MSLKKGFWFFTALALLAFAGQASAGPNANAVLSLDLIADGGAGNGTDDGITSGTVSGRGTTIAIEVFATGVRTSLIDMAVKFDFDSSLLSFVKAENSAFPLTIPEGSTGTRFAPETRNPVALASSGFLARAEFTTVSDVTGTEFSIGIESVTLAESTTSSDELITTSVITFNASPSPDFDGDDWVGFPDFLIFASVFGSQQGDGTYDARIDLNSDGSIGFPDFLIFAQSFGSAPPSTGGGSPDLVVQSPSVSNNNVASGATFTLGATVRNQGNGSSAVTTLHYYRSDDATVSTRDTEVGTDAVRGLAAGRASAESIDLAAPSDAGTYYYGACVDAVTGESDTGNNCSAAVSITVAAVTPPGAGGVNRMYWTDVSTSKIQRSNLDGSGVEDLVTTGLVGPGGIALDVSGGKMYWTRMGSRKRYSGPTWTAAASKTSSPQDWMPQGASRWMCPTAGCTGRIRTRQRSSGPTSMAAASKTSSPQDWGSHLASRWMCPAARCTGRMCSGKRCSGPTSMAAASKTSSPQDWGPHLASR